MPWTQSVEGLSTSGLRLELRIDGEVRQSAAIASMSIPPSRLLDDLQDWAPLQDGDLVFTGTPSGVGQLHPGTHLEAVLMDDNSAVLSGLDLRCV